MLFERAVRSHHRLRQSYLTESRQTLFSTLPTGADVMDVCRHAGRLRQRPFINEPSGLAYSVILATLADILIVLLAQVS